MTSPLIKWQSSRKNPRELSCNYQQLAANYKQIIYVFCCGLSFTKMVLIKRENTLIIVALAEARHCLQ